MCGPVRPWSVCETVHKLLNNMVFYPIMHHSAGNGQFAFHTFLLAPDTDESTFTTNRAYYGQLNALRQMNMLYLLPIVEYASVVWGGCFE